MSKIQALAELGQAIWLDYIQRVFIHSGALQELIDMGLRGMTSNPTIFEKAIAGSRDYDQDLQRLVADGKTTEEIYQSLAIDDIRKAADMLYPVYDQTKGSDGYVSLEVNPDLAFESETTVSEARRLWVTVDRPNLMIKIPGTVAGLIAIRQALAAGVNVNVTLIFSLKRYSKVMEAYLNGLEDRLAAGKPISGIASVASFFVSRVDTKVDKRLEQLNRAHLDRPERLANLPGKAAVANAKLAYAQFREVFENERFKKLQAHGARLQRPLWASTSTKNPAYSDILYVQELIGRHTVNTLPQQTLEAFLDHGQVSLTIEEGLDQARFTLETLEDIGISMDQVTQELEDEGVAAFAHSYASLLESIATKRRMLLAQS